MNNDSTQHVSEQTKREPLQHVCDPAVANQDRAQRDDDTEENNVVMRIQAGEHLGRIRHGGKVGADGYRVRDQQCQRHGGHNLSRKFFAQGTGQALAGHNANARAYHLDRGDERPGDESGP